VGIAAFESDAASDRDDLRSVASRIQLRTPLALFADGLGRVGSVAMPRHALDQLRVSNTPISVADRLMRDATGAGDDSFQQCLRATPG